VIAIRTGLKNVLNRDDNITDLNVLVDQALWNLPLADFSLCFGKYRLFYVKHPQTVGEAVQLIREYRDQATDLQF